jgi:hypothetical protein
MGARLARISDADWVCLIAVTRAFGMSALDECREQATARAAIAFQDAVAVESNRSLPADKSRHTMAEYLRPWSCTRARTATICSNVAHFSIGPVQTSAPLKDHGNSRGVIRRISHLPGGR